MSKLFVNYTLFQKHIKKYKIIMHCVASFKVSEKSEESGSGRNLTMETTPLTHWHASISLVSSLDHTYRKRRIEDSLVTVERFSWFC